MANEVNDALRAAHSRFVTVVAACAVGIFACFPRCSDAERVRSLHLVDALASELDVAAVESALVSQAEASQVQSLAKVVEMAEGPGVHDLGAADARPALFRAAPITLKTLGDLLAQAQEGREVTLVGPTLEDLAVSLRWRIARMGGEAPTRLEALETVPKSASAAQVAAERAVEPARIAAIDARREYDKANERFIYFGDRVKDMVRIGASGKAQWKMQERKREAHAEMEAAQATMQTALETYRKVAEAALAFEPLAEAEGDGVVIRASLTHAGGRKSDWLLPLARVERTVRSAAVPVADELAQLGREPLWPELKDQSVSQAQALVRSRLSWHLWGDVVGPLRVGGVTVLQLFPLLLVGLLYRVSKQCARVRHVYSPFDHPGSDLHRAGTGNAIADMAVLIVPVATVVMLDVWTLWRLEAMWWIALGLGALAIAYAVLVAQTWGDLQELRTNIVRTSFPPPLRGGRR